MNPEDLKNSFRYQFYETSTAFISDTEVYTYFREGENDLNNEIKCCEATYDDILSDGTAQEYTYTATINEIKWVTWNKVPLKQIGFRENGLLDFPSYGGTPTTGDATHYYLWGNKIGLWPIPSTSYTISIRYIEFPTEVTATSTLELPQLFQPYLVDYALWRAYLKDQDEVKANIHLGIWEKNKERARTIWRQRKHGNKFGVVKDIDEYPSNEDGMI